MSIMKADEKECARYRLERIADQKGGFLDFEAGMCDQIVKEFRAAAKDALAKGLTKDEILTIWEVHEWGEYL